ncbi:MAG: hypothetical protein WCJ95_21175, partial [Mariniphaga sp.]
LHNVYLQRQKEKVKTDAFAHAEITKPGITNHLIGKLKGMSQNLGTLSENIEKLRKPASDQLKKSHVGNTSLFDKLTAIANGSELIGNLQFTIEEIPINLSDSKTELTKLYLEQFLNQLRRNNKKKDESHARR